MSMYGRDTERSIDDQLHVGVGIRGGQEQPAEKLARYVAGDRGPAAAQTSAANDDRRTAAGRFASRVGAELPQRVEQILDGPLAHPRRAVEPKDAVPEGEHGRQKPQRGSAVGHVEIGLACRHSPAAADDADRGRRRIVFHGDAEPAERLDHHAGVFAIERAGQQRFAVGQGGADQRAVRDALRARRANGSVQRSGRSDFDGVGHGIACVRISGIGSNPDNMHPRFAGPAIAERSVRHGRNLRQYTIP